MFEGKVALVTGAGSGMGRAIAQRLARDGARTVVTDVREESAREVSAELGGHALALPLDVSDAGSVRSALEATRRECGRLDVLVNNAGILMPGSASELGEENWDRAMAVNLRGVYLVTKAAWESLVATRGAIVNLGSINAYLGMEGNAAYCTAKAGVVMLTKCLALDGARVGIRVNCVCPGWIETPMTDWYFDRQPDPAAARQAVADLTPLGRMGRPSDIADAVAYLASGASSWVSGSALVADGGMLAGVWNGRST